MQGAGQIANATAAIAAQPFTHRSRDRIAESATEAQCRCGRTSKSAHQTPERPPARSELFVSANVHVAAKVTMSQTWSGGSAMALLILRRQLSTRLL